MRYFFLIIGTLLLIANCRSDDAANERPSLQAGLFVRYLAPERQLKGQASFMRADTAASAQPLRLPGGVAFMGSGMQARELPGDLVRYTTTLTAAYPTPLRFSFTPENGGEQRIIELSMSPLDSFAVVGIPSLAAGITLYLASGLQDDESLVCLFTAPDQQARTIIREGPLAAGELLLPPASLTHFTTGDYRLYLVKKQDRQFTQGDLSISSAIEYYTKEIGLTIGN